MTPKKAIRLIRALPTMCEFTDAYGTPIDSDAYYDAVDMAISALQAQELSNNSPKLNSGNGECKWCENIEDRHLRIEYYWIDDEGNTASFSQPHHIATGIANYCPNCGRKLKDQEESV